MATIEDFCQQHVQIKIDPNLVMFLNQVTILVILWSLVMTPDKKMTINSFLHPNWIFEFFQIFWSYNVWINQILCGFNQISQSESFAYWVEKKS